MRKLDARWLNCSRLSIALSSNVPPSACRCCNDKLEVARMTERAAEQVDHRLLLDYYRKMLELTAFEVKVQQLYRNAMLPGFVHLYAGEEAVAVGVCSHLEPVDLVF